MSQFNSSTMSNEDYNPFEHRNVEKPTNDIETFGHIVKTCLGMGILVMPFSFKNAGLWFGLASTIVIGIIMTYGIHLLVKCSHVVCRRAKVPSMLYTDVACAAVKQGPYFCQKFSCVRVIMDGLICCELLGACTVYVIFIAANVKQVVDHYTESNLNVRIYMLGFYPFLALLCQIRSLKYLAPFSMLANLLITISVIICYYYALTDIPPISDRPAVANFSEFPNFFGSVIFNLAGIGVMMHLENEMKNPEHFIGCCSVLNFGMGFVIIMYCISGFIGYLKYGEDTEASLTLNLPQNEFPAQFVKILMSAAILMTFSLIFYVPVNIIWGRIKEKYPEREVLGERLMRVLLSIVCLLLGIAIPNIGPLLSLIGALILSLLAIIIPPIIDLVTFWDTPEYFKYRLFVDTCLILFGVVGLITGTYTSMLDVINTYTK